MHTLEGQRPDEAEKNPVSNYESAMPGYFATMGIQLIAGRDFTEQDDEKAPGVVIVSQSFARSAWPGQDPLGRRLKVSYDNDWLTVVGVVADARYREIETARLDSIGRTRSSSARSDTSSSASAGDPSSIAADIRRACMLSIRRSRVAVDDGRDPRDGDGTVAPEREAVRRARLSWRCRSRRSAPIAS